MNPKFPIDSTIDQLQNGRHEKGPPTSPTNLATIWVYVIFRKNPSSGHEKLNVKESFDGPVFWSRQVLYVFCCSCHFDQHERELIHLLEKGKSLIQRVCLVDRPLDYPFLQDSLFVYLANNLPKLEFVYLRELDLEKINRATVERLSKHQNLKKLIVHGCRNYEVLQDFHNLPQLLVVKGDIVGIKAMVGDDLDEDSEFGSSMPKENGTMAMATAADGSELIAMESASTSTTSI